MPFLPRNFRATIKADKSSRGSGIETITEPITIDASLSEDHTFRNTVSSIPLEDGSKISDHSTVEPDRLEINMLFTDTPTSNFDLTEQLKSNQGRAIKIFEKIKDIRDTKKIVTIVTGLIPHQSMMIEELGVPRRSGDGKKVECRGVFIKVPRVSRSGQTTQQNNTEVAPEIDHTAIGLISIGLITAAPGVGAVLDGLF